MRRKCVGRCVGRRVGSVSVVCRPTCWPTCLPTRWWDRILHLYPYMCKFQCQESILIHRVSFLFTRECKQKKNPVFIFQKCPYLFTRECQLTEMCKIRVWLGGKMGNWKNFPLSRAVHLEECLLCLPAISVVPCIEKTPCIKFSSKTAPFIYCKLVKAIEWFWVQFGITKL